MNNISIFQKSILSIFVFTFTLLAMTKAQTPTCASFTYIGNGVLNATSGCSTSLTIPPADISLSVSPPCTIVQGPSFSIAKSTNNKFYSNGTPVKVDTSLNVTYLATVNDGTNNKVISLTFLVNVKESTPPVINNVPASVTISCNPSPPIGVTASDNCDPSPTISMVVSGIANTCTAPGVITRTWTAKDKYGNTSTATQTITIIKDTTSPILVANAEDNIVDCVDWNSEITTWLDNRANSGATDECIVPEVVYSLNGVSKTQNELISYFSDSLALNKCNKNVLISGIPTNILASMKVGFAYKDVCGNTSATSVATFIAKDHTPPQVDSPANDITIECDTADIVANLTRWYNNFGGAQIIDACSSVITTADLSLLQTKDALSTSQNTSCGNTGKVEVMFYGKDVCDNSSAFTKGTFYISDKKKPVFNKKPVNKTYECQANIQDTLNAFIGSRGGATASDGCSGISWSYFWKEKNGQTGQASALPTVKSGCNWYVDVSFVIKDECNNGDTAKVRFTIQDTKAPVFANLPANVSVACNAVPTVPNDISANDDCNNKATVTFKGETGGANAGCAGTYVLTRTWEAIDSCGNKATGIQKISVTDNVAPVLANMPLNVTADCSSIPSPPIDVTASDNCDTNPSVTFSETSTQGTNPNKCEYHNYIITRTWKATDKCGNQAVSSQKITVQDTHAPTFVVPADITVECYEGEDLDVTGSPTNVGDDCRATPLVSNTDIRLAGNGTCTAISYIQRTWVVSDGCLETTKVQTIQLRDSQAPIISGAPANITLNCGTPLPVVSGIMAEDACSIGVTQTIQYNEQTTTSACVGNSMVKRTWTASDNCGNQSSVSQIVTYIDKVAPVIVYCSPDLTANVNLGDCIAIMDLPAPVVEDACNPTITTYNQTISKTITSTNPGSTTTPVNDINLDFNVSLVPQQSIYNVSFKVNLKNVDAENALEYFSIVGEDGNILGKTNNTATQCGSNTTIVSSLTPAQIYQWAKDGNIQFTLKTNRPVDPAFAINDICPNASAEGNLSFDIKNSNNVTFAYKLDNDPISPIPFGSANLILQAGNYNVTFYAKDCSNNMDSCSYKVSVYDNQKPTMTAPLNKVFDITTDDCTVVGTIPIPTPIDENCDFNTVFSQKQLANGDSLLTFSYDPNLLTELANDVVFTFTGITPSILNNSDIDLFVQFQAKADRPDGYFSIYGENNTFLGKTPTRTCSQTGYLSISIPSIDFNNWAADGKIVINAIHNRTIPVSAAGTNPGITPCTLPLNNGKDNVSWMTATLSYNTAKPYFYTTGATKTALQPLLQAGQTPSVTFKRGVTKVFYTLQDAVGNADTISYTVTVNDLKDPIAKCKNAIIPVNPFTTSSTNFDPLLIDAGSTDNCGIASRSVTPASFICSDRGTKNVTLTVIDSSGRSNSCAATVFVENAEAKPSYKLGICGSDTLELYANPPVGANSSAFSYKWEGPNNFISTEQNPKIPSVSVAYSGTYRVTVTNPFASCTLEGNITIPINSLPNTPIMSASNTKPCTNSELILSTQTYTGKKLKYKWYKDFPTSDVLVDSTTVPSLSIYNPKDTGKYYVVVTVDGCTSNASAPILIMPIRPITATTTNPTLIEICEGGNISLGTNKAGVGYTYLWSGPNGFNATTQYPPVITEAKPLNSGVYTLIIVSNGCESLPVTSEVNVKPKPATPQLIVNGRDCEGATVNLVTDIIGATSYRWIRPDFSEEPTQVNTLVINTLAAAKRGDWRVYAIKDGCRSENSAPVKLLVNPRPVVSATYQTPVCEGGQLTLNGTAPLGSSYTWSNTTNIIGNTQNISTLAQAGIYNLAVIAPNGCDNITSISVTPVAVPQITVVTPNIPACVTGAENAKLTPTVFPFDTNANYVYQWSGPNVSSTDKVLTLPNVTAAANGNYILSVMNGSGCQSKPYTYTLEVKNVPLTPIIKGDAKQSICENEDLLLQLEGAYTGANVSFKWKTPAGDSTTKNPTFKISNVKSFNAGDYSVKVTVNGCESSASGTKQIIVNPTPVRPDVTTNSPVCEGNSIKLMTNQISGATYEWVGPGFSSGISEPIISNATIDKQGNYKVRVIINGCSSTFSNVANVIVNPTPTQIPSISNASPVCMDVANPTVMLSVDPSSAISGATYTWYNTSNVAVSGAASSQLNYSLNLSAYAKKDTTYEFYVIATLNGCPSKQSIPTTVSTNKIPNLQAFAGADLLVCDASSVTLNAANPTIGTGNWIQTEGSTITIANPNSANSAVNGLVSGQNYTLQWKLSNGACKDYAFDEMKIKVSDTSLKAEAGDSINICAKNAVQLNAKDLPVGTTGAWSQVISQEQLGVKITEFSNPKTTVTGLSAGNKYVFKWTISNAACKDYSSDEVYVIVASPQGVAQVEADKKTCGSAANIEAVVVQGVAGMWIPQGSVQVVSPNSASTTVKNLQAGKNKIVWVLSNAVCGVYSSDTLTISTEAAVVAQNDKIDVPYAGKVDIDVLRNDILSSNGYTLTLTNKPKYGTATLSADGSKIIYKANNGFAGFDELDYELCNSACPDVCTSAKVNITVLGGNDCTVPTIITPNGDLTNDYWEIPCLAGTEFPNNIVAVFNQWGDEVYRSSSYKNDWQGTYNGKDLPEGTYFFVVNFGNGTTRNGFLIIER